MSISTHDPAGISPTAHYTSYVWVRHGLSHPALGTPRGKIMYWGLKWFHVLGRLATGGGTLEQGLLQRHLMIDHLLAHAIESGEIGQVVEVAAGLTGRGVRFMERYGDRGLTWVEADLPDMAARKRALLDENGLRRPRHEVVAVNALQDDGPGSLTAEVGPLLDPGVGVAVITEGLLSYYLREDILGMWRRFSAFMGAYPRGRYYADLRLKDEINQTLAVRIFRWGLSVYSGAQSGLEFNDLADASAALKEGGFAGSALHHPRDMADIPGLPPAVGLVSPRIVDANT